MTPKRTTKEILNDAEETMATARLGLKHLRDGEDPRERIAGLRNVVVFGRAVTHVLQNLRSSEPAFDSWYQSHQDNMRKNPLFKYFVELRNKVLKQGTVPTSSSVTFNGDPMAVLQHLGPPPPGATQAFVGDPIGGSGWLVPTRDESHFPFEKYYVALPETIDGLTINMTLHLENVPSAYQSTTAAEACEVYLSGLAALLVEAKNHFGKPV